MTVSINTAVAGGAGAGAGGTGAWGGITGTLADQTDLQAALDAKADWGAPVAINTNTTLTAAAHAGRLLVVDTSGGAITLTLQSDALGGFAAGDEFAVYASSAANEVTVVAGTGTLASTTGMLVATTTNRRFLGFKRTAVSTWAPTEAGAATAAVNLPQTAEMFWAPLNANSSGPSGYGTTFVVAQGTNTATPKASTNLFTQQTRISTVGTTAANSPCGQNVNGISGILTHFDGCYQDLYVEFGLSDVSAAGHRFFAGFADHAGSYTTVTEPSTWLNAVGVFVDSTDTDLIIGHNDGAGVMTEVALGASFPANTADTDWYGLWMRYNPTADAGGRRVDYKIRNLSTGAEASGSLTTNLPAAGTGLGVLVRRNNVASGVVPDVHIGKIIAGTLAQDFA